MPEYENILHAQMPPLQGSLPCAHPFRGLARPGYNTSPFQGEDRRGTLGPPVRCSGDLLAFKAPAGPSVRAVGVNPRLRIAANRKPHRGDVGFLSVACSSEFAKISANFFAPLPKIDGGGGNFVFFQK